MPTYRELLAQARAEIDEISTPEAHALLEGDEQPLFVDVRPRDEWDEGHLPGAIHLPVQSISSAPEYPGPTPTIHSSETATSVTYISPESTSTSRPLRRTRSAGRSPRAVSIRFERLMAYRGYSSNRASAALAGHPAPRHPSIAP